MENSEPLFTIEEVADYCKVDEYSVRRWLLTGKLKGIKLGNGKTSPWRIKKSALIEFLNEQH